MTREFEIKKEVEVEGTPEQVWEAIATGPGISAWFMGPHTVEPGVGGRMTLDLGFFQESATITTWDPPKHLAYTGDTAEDGSVHAMEYLVEGRDEGTTVLRFVHSGIIGGDWNDEFLSGHSHGWDMYLFTLASYVKYFTGKPATYMYVPGPEVPEGVDQWAVITKALGLPDDVSIGDEVTLEPFGITGVVDYARKDYREFLGVRGPEGFYRFFGGGNQIGVGHHLFGDPTGQPEKWKAFLEQAFAQA
ncbi:SRPBCC family protein [Lentzea indica]|uniref:SRPBCC family protein n=1 Tax=Lentzea indica TaxID=2604800 RepID=UPI001438E082|nr:SRPBCC domain-containing protein [Lentzea indica]